MAKKAKTKAGPKKRRNRPPLSKHGELTMDDVEWLAEHSYLPTKVIRTLTDLVGSREEAESAA